MISIDEFNSLSLDEMKTELSKVRKVANARLKRLEQAGLSELSIAYGNAMNNQGKFTSAKSRKITAKAEYKRILLFLDDKTSTVKGTKELWKRTENAFGQSLSANEVTDIWRLYNNWKNNNTGLFNRLGSEQVQSLIGEIFSNSKSVDEMLSEISTSAITEYENQELNEIIVDVWNLGD